MRGCLLFFIMLTLWPPVLEAQEAGRIARPLHNPYERTKNGPPLTNIFHKAKPQWIWSKLNEPRHHPSARMPEFSFTEDETLDIMAYLKSIQEAPATIREWPAWADKNFDDLDDDEFDEVFELLEQGQRLWSNARCSICHAINGPGGKIIGGFVDLRVGGIDLQIAGPKLRRDWLFSWIKEPKDYFPETLMPRFRYSDDEARALVEYILRDDAFFPQEEQDRQAPENWDLLDNPERIERGRGLIELSRCVVCHDLSGISELLTPQERKTPPDPKTFEFLAYDLRCLSCHTIEGRGGTYAPDLSNVGSRLFEEWIEQFVESPDMLRPLSQQMPKFNLTKAESQIISSYMQSNRRDGRIPDTIPGEAIEASDIREGAAIYKTKGCFSCHSMVGEGPGGGVGPTLEDVGNRLKPGYILYHLMNPHALNPYSAEPDYDLAEEEARSLAAYLASKKK